MSERIIKKTELTEKVTREARDFMPKDVLAHPKSLCKF